MQQESDKDIFLKIHVLYNGYMLTLLLKVMFTSLMSSCLCLSEILEKLYLIGKVTDIQLPTAATSVAVSQLVRGFPSMALLQTNLPPVEASHTLPYFVRATLKKPLAATERVSILYVCSNVGL